MKLLSLQNSGNIVDCSMFYNICPQARQHKLPFPDSKSHTTTLFELVHVDTWGPYHTSTHEGHKFFLTIVEDFSRATWTFLLTTKKDATFALKNFIRMIETQFLIKIKQVRSDNALELGNCSYMKKNFVEKE